MSNMLTFTRETHELSLEGVEGLRVHIGEYQATPKHPRTPMVYGWGLIKGKKYEFGYSESGDTDPEYAKQMVLNAFRATLRRINK